MKEPYCLRCLHRIGYGTTIIVAAEIALVASVVGYDAYRKHRRLEQHRADTAYGSGAYQQRMGYLLPHLRRLPRLAALGPDAVRFLAYPALEATTYAVAVRLLPGRPTADGILIIDREPYQRPHSIERHGCSMPAATYRHVVNDVDATLDGFVGASKEFGTDGTDIVVERVRDGKVTSGGGNFVEPYRKAGEVMLRAVRSACAGAALPPPGQDWYQPSS